MNKVVFYIFIAVFLIHSAYAGRYFRHGRLIKHKQNLGAPKYERWFTQYLDHFNITNKHTWQQRYFVNDDLFNKTKKIAFLNIEGEAEASDSWMETGMWYDIAKKHQAILFDVEHRYYGQSHPTEDLGVENLVYLTSQQALADLAFFIQSMNKQYDLPYDVKWIVFGGSYAGSLAAWMRQKYPYYVHGAVSSSGPVLAQLDFPEYFEVVQEALLSSSSECVSAVNESHSALEQLLLTKDGQGYINQQFKLCDKIEDSLDNDLDMASFYESIADLFAGVVQYNNIDPSSSANIEPICKIMTNTSRGLPLARLVAVNNVLFDSGCLDYKYDNYVNVLNNSSWDAQVGGGRQWFYQTCTEFGYYQTSSNNQIFGKFELNLSIKRCLDVFGPKFEEEFLQNAIRRTNYIYGGLDPKVTNVAFVHGSLDPWHKLGIIESLSSSSPAIIIEGASHCNDIYSESSLDSPQLKAAKEQIKTVVGSWLDQ